MTQQTAMKRYPSYCLMYNKGSLLVSWS